MIKLSYEQILEKIQSQTKKPASEIESLVHNKLKQLSDLISKEGAAHIIANELKVKLYDKIEGKQKIKDLVSGMNSIDVLAKVISSYGIREFQKDNRKGKVATLFIGDETGSSRAVIWDEKLMSDFEKINEGDILYSAIPDNDFRKFKELKKHLTQDEKEILKEIASIMREKNPVWGI